MEIKFIIADEKVPRIVEAMKELYPIPQIPVDPEKPEEGTKPQFTDNEWAREVVRRWIIAQTARYEQAKAQMQIKINPDDALVQ